MKRIRLQIQIVPWDKPSPPPVANQQARQDEVRPWTQPEDAENTLQQLVENITQRYGRIYVGRGALKVKELQDSWGSTLDLTDTVGDVFDDRSSSGDILTSICKVIRYPPNPAELHNPNRFASLLPESSARPQKRPPPPLFSHPPRLHPSIENAAESARQSAFVQPNKRRKTTREASTRDCNAQAVPLSQERIEEGHSQRSEHQVLDSQNSPTRNGNSYGTPNSSKNRDQAPSTQNNFHVVPDSPINGRRSAYRHDRERTKSESPELRVSVHDVAPSQEEVNQAKKPSRLASHPPSHERLNNDPQPVVSSQPSEIVEVDEARSLPCLRPEANAQKTLSLTPNLSGTKASLQTSPNILTNPPVTEAIARTSPGHIPDRPVPGSIAHAEATHTRRTKADVFDPIESDSEGFQARQRMFPAKRLRLSKTPDKTTTIPGKGLTMSAPKSQLRRPKANGFLLSTSNNSKPQDSESNHHGVGATSPRATMTGYEKGIAVYVPSPKSVNDRDRAPEAVPLNPQARSSPRSVEAEVSAEVLSQLAASEINLSDKEDQRADQSEPPQPSSSNSQDSSEDAKSQSIDATNHPNEGDELPQLSPNDDVAGSSASKSLNVQEITNAGAESQTAGQPSGGPTKSLMGPPAIPNAYVELWKKSSPAERNNHPQEMASQTLSQGSQLNMTTLDDSTAQIPKMTSASYPSKKALQEKRLTEQAEKMMVAADGARQLQLDQARLQQGANTPKANGWTAVNRNTAQQRPMTKRQEADQKRRETQSAAAKRFREKNQYVTSSPHEVALTNSQGIPSSQLSSSRKIESEGLSSSASNVDSMSSSKRRTLTPSHPPPTSSDPRKYSSPLSSRSVASNGLPLKSALKQPASNLRRSVSQVAFNEKVSGPMAESRASSGVSSSPLIPQMPKDPPASTLTKAKPAAVPAKPVTETQRKGTTKPTTKPATRKVQSTLNVTRDKKQKGRLRNPPFTKELLQQDKSSSSSSDDDSSISSFLSDEVADIGISKAGPSSKQKPTSMKNVQPRKKPLTQTETSKIKPSSALPEAFSSSIDPALQALKPSASQSSVITSTHGSQSNHGSSKHAEEPTSGQIGTSDNSSDSESDSDDGPILSRCAKPAKNGVGNHRSSKASSASSEDSAHSHSANVDPNDQLHRETLKSLSAEKTKKSGKIGANGMLANGTRNASYKYPSLSQLKRDAQGKPYRPRVVPQKAHNQIQEKNPVVSESESDEDDSESNSESGSNIAATHKKESGFMAGARGLWKLMQTK